MRQGVPFIAPRQLGAVESNLGRLILPSVVWRTGQSGARFLSFNDEADRWQTWSRWCTGHVRCTPDSPVPSSSRWLGHVSRADRAADRWLTGQSGAHRTVMFLKFQIPLSLKELYLHLSFHIQVKSLLNNFLNLQLHLQQSPLKLSLIHILLYNSTAYTHSADYRYAKKK